MNAEQRGSTAPYLLLAVLIPSVAHASFSAAPCSTFACHFQGVGILLGVIGGLEASGVIFVFLHAGLAHPARSKTKQMILGGIVGLVGYEIAAAAGAYYAVFQHPDRHTLGGRSWWRMRCS